jgi:ubiquitin C-terminal hydrolase
MNLKKMINNYNSNSNNTTNLYDYSINNYQNESDNNINNDNNNTNGLCGLANEHAWCCYMNSVLQCFSNLKIFRKYIVNIDEWYSIFQNSYDNCIPENPSNLLGNSKFLCFQIYRLFDVMWKTSDETYDPRSFQNLFLDKVSYFDKGIQQDSQETLIKFLEILHNELSPVSNYKDFKFKFESVNFNKINSLIENGSTFPNIITDEINNFITNYNNDFTNVIVYRCIKNHYLQNKFSYLSDIFGGFQANELICPITNKKRIKVESFYLLTIPIPSDNSENKINNKKQKINNYNDHETKTNNCINNSNYTLNLDTSQISDNDGDLFVNDSDSDSSVDQLYNVNSPYYNNIHNDSLFNENDNITMNFNSNNFLNNNKNNNCKNKNPKSYSLDECFELFTKPEILDDDNKWNSPFSNSMVNATKMTYIWEPPKILIIGLKRNEVKINYDGKTPTYINSKKSNKITFKVNNFNIKKYIHPLKKNTYNNSKYIYNLWAINNHSGNTENGHYWSYCKNSIDNKWYNFNDDNVNHIDEDNIVSKNAYILFYIRSDIN